MSVFFSPLIFLHADLILELPGGVSQCEMVQVSKRPDEKKTSKNSNNPLISHKNTIKKTP